MLDIPNIVFQKKNTKLFRHSFFSSMFTNIFFSSLPLPFDQCRYIGRDWSKWPLDGNFMVTTSLNRVEGGGGASEKSAKVLKIYEMKKKVLELVTYDTLKIEGDALNKCFMPKLIRFNIENLVNI